MELATHNIYSDGGVITAFLFIHKAFSQIVTINPAAAAFPGSSNFPGRAPV